MSGSLPPFNSSPSFRLTEPPHPSWSIGDKIETDTLGASWKEGEKEGWTVIDTQTEPPRKLYALMISGIIPRPIGFVSTVSENNVYNLAPFSWFNMISALPPLVLISCTNVSGRVHDSTTNIKANKQFSVNMISEPFIQGANFSSVDAPPEQSEWPGSGLTMAPSVSIKPPRVKESAFSMECELYHLLDIKPPGMDIATVTVMFGLVKTIHVRNDVLKDNGTVDPTVFRPVSRLGDITFGRLGEGFQLPRGEWEKLAEAVTSLEAKEK